MSPAIISTGNRERAFIVRLLDGEEPEAIRAEAVNYTVMAGDWFLLRETKSVIEKPFIDLRMPQDIVKLLVDAAFESKTLRVEFKTNFLPSPPDKPSVRPRYYSDFKIVTDK